MNSELQIETEAAPVRVLLAGPDTLYFSFDTQVSVEMRSKLDAEKQAAKIAAKANQVHCPEWLGARVLPNGSKGGYSVLIETEDFTVKVLGEGIPHRPGLYIELRSLFLHTHRAGPAGACEEAIVWLREQLLYDQEDEMMHNLVSFTSAKLSRADLHIDWQGGYAPQLASASDELRRFIRPGKTKWGFYGAGQTPTGYTFGKGDIQARLYNKTIETKEKANDAYAQLLTSRNGDTYDPEQDVWRLEFELKRQGAKGFKLYAKPEVDDDEAEIEAELSAEELEHIGALPRFFARMGEVFSHLTLHWLRFVVDDGTTNRSRWPLHPTWETLRDEFTRQAQEQTQPLEDDARELVRGSRYNGKARILRRLQVGVLSSLEIEDASPTSAALLTLKRWANQLVEKETARAEARRAHYLATEGRVPRWVERGMGARIERAEQVHHRVQMLLGIFGAKGVLSLEFKPAHSLGDLLVQHLDEMEQEATNKGGVEQVLQAHFAKVYKVALPQAA